MTEGQLLDRIDRHLERADGHMARGNELMAEIRGEMGKTREVMRDHRDFIREITARQERVTQKLVEEIAANTRRIDAGTARLEDLRLAGNQQTAALMRMLDRLD